MGYGGGLYLWGGAHSVRNCVIQGNDGVNTGWGTYGHGCYLSANVAFENCDVLNNNVQGIYYDGGAVSVSNSIFWGNTDDLANFPAARLFNCDIGNGDNNGTNGCFALDPRFERGLYLATNSPCVDAGSADAVSAGMSQYTTRADGAADTGTVDVGYHQAAGMNWELAELYVKTNGSDANSGTNWTESLATIGKALSLARAGTHIHLAGGTYSTNSMESFPLAMEQWGLQLLGTNRATTIINAAGSDRKVVAARGVLGDGRVEELTLTGGNSTNLDGLYMGSMGGGLSIRGCGMTVNGCRITSNTVTAMDSPYWPAYGGGLYAAASTIAISDCLIRGNTGSHLYTYGPQIFGGGVAIVNGAAAISMTLIGNNRALGVVGNMAYGGGLYLGGGRHRILNGLIWGNSLVNCSWGPFGDGAYLAGATNTLENVTLALNGSQGIYYYSGATSTVKNCIAWSNGMDLVNFPTNALGELLNVSYSDIGQIPAGCVLTNFSISANPLFADTNYFHPQSVRGSYAGGYFDGGYWAHSPTNSPCVDAGDPASEYRREPSPHGRRVNMGYDVNTAVASLSAASVGSLFVVH